MDVDWVVLQASVHDCGGHSVAKLRQQDFAVFEDGNPQEIRLFRQEDTPVTVGLVSDHSGSMREKLGEVTTLGFIMSLPSLTFECTTVTTSFNAKKVPKPVLPATECSHVTVYGYSLRKNS
jgi:hypothetical protein